MHTILCILIEISVKIKSYLSCVMNGEFYFSNLSYEDCPCLSLDMNFRLSVKPFGLSFRL